MVYTVLQDVPLSKLICLNSLLLSTYSLSITFTIWIEIIAVFLENKLLQLSVFEEVFKTNFC
jgi:hypothetical protein